MRGLPCRADRKGWATPGWCPTLWRLVATHAGVSDAASSPSYPVPHNQVRITSVNKVRNYISYAVALLEEKGHSSVTLKAMGQAINKAVVIGEE